MKILLTIILSFGFLKAHGFIGQKTQGTFVEDFYKLSETNNHQTAGGGNTQVSPYPYLLNAQGPAAQVIVTPPLNTTSPVRHNLTWDMIDRLLMAEIDLQNNDLAPALEKYLEIARKTWDSSVSIRAVQIAELLKTSGGEDKVAEAVQLRDEANPSNIEASKKIASYLVLSGNIEGAVDHFTLIIDQTPNTTTTSSISIKDISTNIDDIPLLDPDKKLNRLFKQRNLSFNNIIGSGFRFTIKTLSKFIKGEHEEAAVNTMKQLVSEYEKENVEAQIALAVFLNTAERTSEALAAIESAAPFASGNTEITIFHAQLYQQNKKDQKAIDVLESFLRHHPNSRAIRIIYTSMLTDMGQYEKAVDEYEKLLRKYPHDNKNRYLFGIILWHTDQVDRAEQEFEKLLDSDVPFIVSLANYSLGQIAESKKEYDNAGDFYDKVTTNQSHALKAQIKIAGIMAKQGDLEAGRNHLYILQPINAKQLIDIYNAEANMLIDAGQYDEMKMVYQKALKRFPGNYAIITEYLHATDGIGQVDIDFVEQYINDMLIFNPNDSTALNYLGYSLLEYTDRYEEALEMLERALQIEPRSSYILDSVGWALFRLERYDEALEHLEEARFVYFPEVSAEIEAHIGEVYWVLGQKEKARQVWNKALEKKLSDEEYLIKTMERLDPPPP